MRKSVRGFTIVELLIVIVVIATLASITVVAYNGIQRRASNTQMIAATRTYVQALAMYSADKNSYPTNFTPSAVCLGDGYPADHCWIGPNGDFTVMSNFDTPIAEYMTSKPRVPAKYYAITSQDNRAGIIFYRYSLKIEYLLDGANQPCVIEGATAQNGANNTTTRCTLMLPPV